MKASIAGLRDRLRVLELQLREQVDLLVAHLEAAPREEVAAAPADQPERDLRGRTLRDEGAGPP